MGITARQFEQMQKRLSGARTAAPVFQSTRSAAGPSHQVILGVDPSLRATGYGVIRVARPCPETLVHGTISCPAGWQHSRCLLRIAEALREIVKQYRPTVCVIEGIFYAQNLQTAIIMGQARGASLVSAAERPEV